LPSGKNIRELGAEANRKGGSKRPGFKLTCRLKQNSACLTFQNIIGA
jgi:hypothetical protein